MEELKRARTIKKDGVGIEETIIFGGKNMIKTLYSNGFGYKYYPAISRNFLEVLLNKQWANKKPIGETNGERRRNC